MSSLIESGVDWFSVVVSRQQVETQDVDAIHGELLLLLKDVDTARTFRGRVDIGFAGWESDPRELFEIPSVVSFMRDLDQRFPYWFYFLDPDGQSLKIVTLCLSNAKAVGPGLARRDAQAFTEFMLSHYRALNAILSFCGQDGMNVELSERIATKLMA